MCLPVMEVGGRMEIAMTRVTNFASQEEVPVRRYRSVWSRLVQRLFAGRIKLVGREIEQYLEHHRYDLAPEVRIGLERHENGHI
jgi:hypothetical protein